MKRHQSRQQEQVASEAATRNRREGKERGARDRARVENENGEKNVRIVSGTREKLKKDSLGDRERRLKTKTATAAAAMAEKQVQIHHGDIMDAFRVALYLIFFGER